MVSLQVHALHIIVETALQHMDLVLAQQLVVTDRALKHAQQTGVAIVHVILVILPDVVEIVIHRL